MLGQKDMKKKYKCEECKDTKFVGDNRAGMAGNNEYEPCSNSIHNKSEKAGKRTYEKATIEDIKKTLNRIDFLLYNENFNDTDRVCITKTAILELDLFGKSN